MTQQGPEREPFTVKIESLTARDPMADYCRSMFKLWNADAGGFFAEHAIRLVPPTLPSASDIPLIRNKAIADSLKPELKWDAWLWIDDDQTCEPKDIVDLVDAMRRGAVDIVSPLIAKRLEAKHYEPVAYKDFDDQLGRWVVWTTGWEEPNLYETPAVGSGFCLVKREVFERMPEPWYERFHSTRHRDRWFGNDLYFCYKAKASGFRIWLHSGVEVGHLGVKARYVRKDFVESGRQQKLLHLMQTAGSLKRSDKRDLNTPDFWDEHWQDKRWVDAQDRRALFKEVLKFVPNEYRVLHFGCGDGQLTRYLVDQTSDTVIHGVDLSPVAISHARRKDIHCHLISNMNLNGKTPPVPGWGQFDLLLITGWIERLVDPGTTLEHLIKHYLNPGGQVVAVTYNSVFGPTEVPEHHHLLSKHNLGELLNRFGRVLEMTEFKDYFGQEPNMMAVPMLVARSTIEKVKLGPTPVEAGEEIANVAGR